MNKNNVKQDLTTQEIAKLIMEIKLGILQQLEKALDQAIKEKNSTMVAAIAEILKSYWFSFVKFSGNSLFVIVLKKSR